MELVQCLIEMPRSARALAGLQGGGNGLGPFHSNVVVCIPTTTVRLVIMLHSLKAQGACRSIKHSAEGLTVQIEPTQCHIEMPRSVRALAGLQGGGDGLGPFISNDGTCIPPTKVRILIMPRSLKTQEACRSIKDSAEGLTVKIEPIQCHIEMPRSIRALAGLQGGGNGLKPFISNVVTCIPTTAVRLVIMLRSLKTQGACRSIRDSAKGLTAKIEIVQCHIEMPRSVRALAGLQGGGDGHGPFHSNLVDCIPRTAVRLDIMLRSLKTQGACRSIRDSAEGLTVKMELVQCLIEMPRSVRALAGLQGGGDGLGPFISNVVTCIPRTTVRLVIMLRSLKTQGACRRSGTPPKDSL